MHPSFFKLIALALLLAPLGAVAADVSQTRKGKAPSFEALLQRPLSLVEALNIATEQNGIILQAHKSVEARLGVAIQTRAILLPQVLGRVDYSVTQDSLVELNTGFTATGPTLNNQRWVGDARVVQSLYQGGRLLSALRASRLIREQAMQDFLTTLGQVLLQVRTAYDDVQLAAAQIEVRQASVDLLKGELDNVRSRLAAGVVSEFDQLRAEVELSNAPSWSRSTPRSNSARKTSSLPAPGTNRASRLLRDTTSPAGCAPETRATRWTGRSPGSRCLGRFLTGFSPRAVWRRPGRTAV